MTIQGVLVEYESLSDKEIYTNSGLLFSDNYVIITGNVLMPYLKQFNINTWLGKLTPGILNYNVFPSKTNPELKIVIKSKNPERDLIFKKAQVAASFICTNILASSQKYLRDWAIDFENKEFQIREILSLFFILKITQQTNYLDLNEALGELLKNAMKSVLEVGEDVFIESTPFGNRAFVNSYSQGIISNLTGENCCFMLTDCPSTPGSEGSPVFIKRKCQETFLIGIVISSLNWWKGEWVGLTLAANIVPLLSQMVENLPATQQLCNPNNYFGASSTSDKLLSATTKSLVQVVCGSGWGTGILIDKNKGIVLTNSHVITSNRNVVLHWKNEQTEASVLYQTPNLGVYDLAVLQSDSINRLDMEHAEISFKTPEIGKEVYAAGFPIFSRDLKPKPSLTKGHISQVHMAMINTTCTVLPGSSGGAIFTPQGELVAIIVSNTRMDDVGVVYPRVNMAIPILTIYRIIEEFLLSGDISCLSRLHSQELSVSRQWGNFLGKL